MESTVEEPRVSAAIPKREREKVFSRGSLPQSSLTLAPPSDLDSAPVLGGSGLRPALTLAPTPEAPLLFFLLVFLLLLRCSRLPYRLACFSVFEAFLEAPSLERSSVSGSWIYGAMGSGGTVGGVGVLGFWRRSLKPLLEFGCAWRREPGLCSDLISGFLDLRLRFDYPFLGVLVKVSSVCLRQWGIGAPSSSVASLTEGGGVQRRGVGVGRLWSLQDVAATSLLFGLFSSRLVVQNRSLKLCRPVSLVFARVLFGSIAPLSPVAICDIVSLPVLGFLRRRLAMMLKAPCGLRAVQVLVQRSTCSRLLAYRSWFGGHRVSKPLAGRGAFEDCIEGLRAIFNDVTEIPGIRGNEVNLTFPWSTSKGRTALDS
ncbi:hypothetical protein HID58_007152 [Brassica napus]|uniref:Transmembrane protein n=1 Tax=Brassica napus TaxID=3708 RepID=A0ABQ8EDE6_BRANA|nr:hypothetical protein HID58_092313 [Brassica napus]KAH0939691.1 hypothetical protein HID58_007152 [Brassica napus]